MFHIPAIFASIRVKKIKTSINNFLKYINGFMPRIPDNTAITGNIGIQKSWFMKCPFSYFAHRAAGIQDPAVIFPF